MDERNNDFDFDFTPIGLAIKKARTAQGMTREQLARIVDYDPRHLQAIENEGQKPSLELFIGRNFPAHTEYLNRCIPFQNCASDNNWGCSGSALRDS